MIFIYAILRIIAIAFASHTYDIISTASAIYVFTQYIFYGYLQFIHELINKRNKRTFSAAWRMKLHIIRDVKNRRFFKIANVLLRGPHEFRSNDFGQWAETTTGFQVHITNEMPNYLINSRITAVARGLARVIRVCDSAAKIQRRVSRTEKVLAKKMMTINVNSYESRRRNSGRTNPSWRVIKFYKRIHDSTILSINMPF